MPENPDQRARFSALAEEVKAAGDVLTISAQRAKDAWGGQRLGSNIRSYISVALEDRGIGHIPQEFPDRETAEVRLYRRGTEVGDLIAAVLNTGADNDTQLRKRVADVSPAAELENRVTQVRHLIGEIVDILDES